jgi:hypothetical protein
LDQAGALTAEYSDLLDGGFPEIAEAEAAGAPETTQTCGSPCCEVGEGTTPLSLSYSRWISNLIRSADLFRGRK